MELFFVRGGSIWPSDSNPFYSAGQNGYYWSSMARSTTSLTYSLYFNASSVNPSYSLYRYYGYSLRCLIPTP